VLRADGEAEMFGRVWGALFEVCAAFLRVVQFVGELAAVDGDFGGVEGVRRVDGCEGFIVGRVHCEDGIMEGDRVSRRRKGTK